MTVSAPKYFLIGCVGVAVVVAAALFNLDRQPQLRANGTTIAKLEVVRSPEALEQGLGGRDHLASDRAMLFELPDASKNCFWMKDMRFALDIVWLDADKRIIAIAPDLQPRSYPQSYCAPLNSPHVIELNAGQANRYHLAVGQQLSW